MEKSPLALLAAEIREKIYAKIFPSQKTLKRSSPDHQAEVKIDIALLLTCKFIYNEAAGLLYKNNSVAIAAPHRPSALIRSARELRNSMNNATFAMIRSITVVIDMRTVLSPSHTASWYRNDTSHGFEPWFEHTANLKKHYFANIDWILSFNCVAPSIPAGVQLISFESSVRVTLSVTGVTVEQLQNDMAIQLRKYNAWAKALKGVHGMQHGFVKSKLASELEHRSAGSGQADYLGKFL